MSNRQSFTTSIRFISLVTILIFSGTACSPFSFVLNHNPDLAESSFKFFADHTEKKITRSPNDPQKLLSGCQALTQYGYGFLMEEADRVIAKDYNSGKTLYSEANNIFVRAVSYGNNALMIKYSNFQNWMDGKIDSRPNFNSDDLPFLYWLAGAYGGAIKSSRGNPKWLIQLPNVGKLLEMGLSIDADWNKGSFYSAMITYTMIRHDVPSNKVELAEIYFKKAVTASNGKDLGPYVAMAENVCIPTQNKNEFTNLIYKALNIDINADPELRLTNQINRNRAEWLLDNIDEYFY